MDEPATNDPTTSERTVYTNPTIGNSYGPATYGPNSSMHIENLIQTRQFTDLFRAGTKALDERHYEWARRAFEGYLRGTDSTDSFDKPEERCAAFVYYAIARLGALRPHHHRMSELTDIKQHLLLASGGASGQGPAPGTVPAQGPPGQRPAAPESPARVMAAVIAAQLREDVDNGSIRGDTRFADLARSASVDKLTDQQLRTLVTHLAPSPGQTWETLRTAASAKFRDLQVEAFEVVHEKVSADPERRRLVPRYFTPDPHAPKPVTTTSAIVMLALGVVSLVGSCALVSVGVGGPSGDSVLSGACVSVLFLGAAIGLFVGSAKAFARNRLYRAAKRQYDLDWHAARPKPSDAQMDQWLNEDVNWIATLGAEKHNLRNRLLGDGGSLLDQPQALVGLSGRTQRIRHQGTVADSSSPTGFRLVVTEIDVPVARVRYGLDGRLRADNYQVLVIYLTRDRVCVFEVELEVATRRLVSTRRLAFRYRDVVAIEVSTEPVGRPEAEQIQKQLAAYLLTGVSVRVVEGEKVTLSIVDGDKVMMRTGYGFVEDLGPANTSQPYADPNALTDRQVAWENRRVVRNVELQVWERREVETR